MARIGFPFPPAPLSVLSFPHSSLLGSRLVTLRRGLLLAVLAALYLVLWLGPQSVFGKTFFIVHLGLFMLWQPFVHAEQRLSPFSLLAVGVAVLAATLFLQGWVLVIWIMMLAGIVGGKVLLFGARSTRLFYLLALGFLVVALLLMAAPVAVPRAHLPEQIRALSYFGLPLTLIVMGVLPRAEERDRTDEVVDFIYSVFIFLLLAVLVLGTLAAMHIFGSDYVDALLQALLLMGLILLLLGWAWNPHAGFAGIGGLFSRYMMSIGLPVELWLKALADLALREDDAEAFLEQACVDMARRLPWVAGVQWQTIAAIGRFGETVGHSSEIRQGGLKLVLFTRQPLSPTLLWHFNLLAQLLAEFHADKLRALALKQLSYMQAIHETGARLTHDVKNLLQSLNALCVAVNEPGAEASPAYHALLRRQLPAISGRLEETLAKLRAPEVPGAGVAVRRLPARQWHDELRLRLASQAWIALGDAPESGEIPAEVFSGVVDNLVRNASEKRLLEPGLQLSISLQWRAGALALCVCDDGSAVPEELARRLFLGPVASASGLGIGLFQAARHAESVGYQLVLTENRPGRVCFCLVSRDGLAG